MQLRHLIRPDIAASVLVHAFLLGLIVLFSEVHPFGTVTAEPIVVDLVTPTEAAAKDEKPAGNEEPQGREQDVVQPAPETAAEQQTLPEKPQDRVDKPEQAQAREPGPSPAQMPPAPPAAPPAQQRQTYTPPEPDLTVKYGVMLGLPDALPPANPAADRPVDGTDANASSPADLSSSLVAKFRAHLKSCSKLPAAVARSDNLFVKLRVLMTPQAKLAGEPMLIEGSATIKALELKKSAVQALSACQPYDMLPADRYGEWKVLDLTFVPQDFS